MVGSERTRRLGNFFCCRGNARPGAPEAVRRPKQASWGDERQSFQPPSAETSSSDLMISPPESRGGYKAEHSDSQIQRPSRKSDQNRRSRQVRTESKSVSGEDLSRGNGASSETNSNGGAQNQVVTQMQKDARMALYPQLGEEDLQDLLRLHEQFKGPLLGPQRSSERGKKTLVLDLDETLVHSSFQPVALAAFVIPVEIESLIYEIYVAKRPGVDEFLNFCAELYEVVIFTASVGKYAGPLLDKIDPEGRCPWRLYRDACLLWQGNYIKDLSKLGRDLKDVLIVDNSPASSILQPDNAIPIRSWFDDQSDRELYELMPILRALSRVDDIQAVMRRTATCESIESDDGDNFM
eukprot:Gregarina_sp_Pseudo_9__2817@NODE_304_length_3212_cov_18_570123_g285_i0_p2_GENE_NODE_304_length_3212_cov_18_570123_g285_i0NODE_304_length_3212_cov_18_570123_g285_i0_p2_ORF_typecomplete_len352_score32_25NIF/PF03031_18/1_5e49_NODE_304_length_3212_cov_18_570123_g285_i05501605